MKILLLFFCCATLSAIEMRFYVMGMVYRGPNTKTEVTEESKKLQAGHMANITKLAAEKQLILAAPMAGNGDPRRNFIFDTDDVEKAQEWCDQDSAVQAGTLRVELHPWYLAKEIGILEAPKP